MATVATRHFSGQNWGEWKRLKCGNRSTETEVRKPKYESEKKSRLGCLVSALLTHEGMC